TCTLGSSGRGLRTTRLTPIDAPWATATAAVAAIQSRRRLRSASAPTAPIASQPAACSPKNDIPRATPTTGGRPSAPCTASSTRTSPAAGGASTVPSGSRVGTARWPGRSRSSATGGASKCGVTGGAPPGSVRRGAARSALSSPDATPSHVLWPVVGGPVSEPTLQHEGQTVLRVGGRDLVGYLDQRRVGVAHRDAVPGPPQHLEVVRHVTERNHVGRRDAVPLRHLREPGGLRDTGRRDLDQPARVGEREVG